MIKLSMSQAYYAMLVATSQMCALRLRTGPFDQPIKYINLCCLTASYPMYV
jgi:hypothetical protein